MGFFDEAPPRGDERWQVEPHRQPDWIGPPENMAGATVVLDVVLANTGQAAAVLQGATAFPTGVLLRLGLARRPAAPITDSYERFRFGIGLPDGRRLVPDRWHDEPEATARLVHRGGGGGGLTWDESYWLWPLPPPGALLVACEWTDEGIEETVIELDTAPLREAARRAVELWPDDRPVVS
jgi:hypothetical protein